MLGHEAPRSAYVHVPFCAHRCGYCNFTLVAGRDDLLDLYLDAISSELSRLGEPRQVDTLFLGGGTPSHLGPAPIERLLAHLGRWLPLASGGEFSLEANPNDIDAARLEVWRRCGVNRVSVGAQSFSPAKLATLERRHDPPQIRSAVRRLQDAGYAVSLDLIFAAPGESLAEWRADLAAAIDLRPEHVSTYGLTFERGTSFGSRRDRGQLAAADEELERAMYELAIDTLTAAGYEHYEVSNFARPGRRCRHNEACWAGRTYLAFGPGAARFVAGRRETNHRSVTTYLRRMHAGQSPVAEIDELPPAERARELLVIGLRRLAGVERDAFRRQTGFSLDDLAGEALASFCALGLFADEGRRVRLTRAGLLVSDALWGELLSADQASKPKF